MKLINILKKFESKMELGIQAIINLGVKKIRTDIKLQPRTYGLFVDLQKMCCWKFPMNFKGFGWSEIVDGSCRNPEPKIEPECIFRKSLMRDAEPISSL